jgi:superfamily II DNA/RNA helicase
MSAAGAPSTRPSKPYGSLPIFSVIVAPTRELARQIYDQAVLLLKNTGFSAQLLTSGMDERKSGLGKPGVRTGLVLCAVPPPT